MKKISNICKTCEHLKNDVCELDFNRASDEDDFFADKFEDVYKCPDYVDGRYSADELLDIDILG